MMRNLRSIARVWLPSALWMTLIFIFSTDSFAAPNTSSIFAQLLSWLVPGIAPATIEIVHGMVRKPGHLTEYFILARFLGNAAQTQCPRQSSAKRCLVTIVIATLYAASDEWHQSFVPSRSASVVDVAIDACGAICAALWSYWRDSNRNIP